LKKTGKIVALTSFIGLLLSPILSWSQEVKLEAYVNRNPIKVGERIQYSVKLSNADSDTPVNMPNITDFRILYGPSRSSNVSIINGKMSRSLSISYILIAQKEGDFTINPASAIVDGTKYETRALKVKVIEADSQANNTPNNQQQQTQQANTPTYQGEAPKANENIILRVVPSRTSAYIGEPIRLDYILYSRYSSLELASFEVPPINGFWIEDIDSDKVGWSSEGESINGVYYNKAVLKSQIIFPQNKGQVTSTVASAECIVNRSFFNAGSRFKAESNTLKLNIKDFTSAIPSNFSGLTGKLSLGVDIDKNEVATNEPITLKIKYTGSGNLNFVKDPVINFPSDFEVYDPKESNSYKISSAGFKGSKTFEYLIIPRYAGEYNLGNINLSYFDPSSNSFKQLKSDDLIITVTQGNGSAATVSNGQQNVKALNSDINFIITTPPNKPSALHFFNPAKLTFYICLFILFAVGFVAQALIRKNVASKANVVAYKYKKASKEALKKLAKAKKHMQAGNNEAFFLEMSQSIYNYLADKLNMSPADLNRSAISDRFASKPEAKKVSEQLFLAIDACEMARFSPSGTAEPKVVYENVSQLISNLESVL